MSTPEKIVVAMSGGVDSSVAAYLLAQEGQSCLGISMQVWDYRNNGGACTRATCCAPDDFTDARKVASKIGIPYYVFDFEKTFRKEVIDNFVQTYARGETPNPCVECNNKVKFRSLRDRAKALGCSHVATGHYAQIAKDDSGYHLLRGADPEKDQSYFLYGIQKQELAETLFPVGHFTKDQVRKIAREADLVTAEKPESQDICFVSGTVQDFLVQVGGRKASGKIVKKDGTYIGEHEGINNYTVGQRKGLKVGGQENPLYVIEINPSENTVVVGSREDLEREKFSVREINWIEPQLRTFDAIVQVRYRHKGVPARVTLTDSNSAVVAFSKEWATVSPGQSCVFYDLENRVVLGGGRIGIEKSGDLR